MNKKGTEEILSFWWFLMAILIVGSIIVAIVSFYSAESDVRPVEAEMIASKILNCITENGFLKNEVLEDDFDIFVECQFNELVFEEERFSFSLALSLGEEKLREDIVVGPGSFILECNALKGQDGEKVEAKYFPVCLERKTKVLFETEGEILKVDVGIFSVSNQRGEKVSVIK